MRRQSCYPQTDAQPGIPKAESQYRPQAQATRTVLGCDGWSYFARQSCEEGKGNISRSINACNKREVGWSPLSGVCMIHQIYSIVTSVEVRTVSRMELTRGMAARKLYCDNHRRTS